MSRYRQQRNTVKARTFRAAMSISSRQASSRHMDRVFALEDVAATDVVLVLGVRRFRDTLSEVSLLRTEVGPGRAVEGAGHHGGAPHHRGTRVRDPGCCQPLLSSANTIGRFSLGPARPP